MSNERISVAISLFNEDGVIVELLQRLGRMLAELPGGPHELVLVDDGSTDRTAELLAAAAAEDPRVVAISLSRRFGHQAALSAALDHVSGDVVIVMDGDLQDPPEAIPQFMAEYHKGFDVVYARRVQRKEGALLRLGYFLFYRMVALLSDVRLPLDAGDFALLSRRVVDGLRSLPEHHRYLRGLRTWVGFQQTGIPVERSERFAGTSKYSGVRLFALAFDAVFAFSMVPLRAASLLGLTAVLGSLLFATYSVYVKLVHGQTPRGFTALIVAFAFLSGVQLLFLGVIGEYVGRVYEETKGRPHYLIRTITGRPRDGS